MQYGELYFLQEPAESSGCGEEEEGQGGVLGQVSLKLQEGIFLNVDSCPCACAPPYEQMEVKTQPRCFFVAAVSQGILWLVFD